MWGIMMKKIYIIGSVASGKSTLAKKLSKKLKIDCFELDKVIWNDEKHVKRSKMEVSNLFLKILSNDAWIIEDVGRNDFLEGIKQADIVYFLDINKYLIYFRILKRWIFQKLNIEKYNYKPNLKTLIQLFKWAKNYKNDEHMETIKKYNLNYQILKSKDIKKIANRIN